MISKAPIPAAASPSPMRTTECWSSRRPMAMTPLSTIRAGIAMRFPATVAEG